MGQYSSAFFSWENRSPLSVSRTGCQGLESCKTREIKRVNYKHDATNLSSKHTLDVKTVSVICNVSAIQDFSYAECVIDLTGRTY